MSQRFLSSLSAALVLSTLGIMPSSYGSEVAANDDGLEENVPLGSALVSNVPNQNVSSQNLEVSTQSEPVKIGEYQSQSILVDTPMAVIHAHVMDGRQAATVYVGGIPVLTFLGDEAIAQAEASVSGAPEIEAPDTPELSLEDYPGSSPSANSSDTLLPSIPSASDKGIKLPSPDDGLGAANLASPKNQELLTQRSSGDIASVPSQSTSGYVNPSTVDVDDPVQQATAIAARINQLEQSGINAEDIVAEWDDEAERFVIKAGDTVLVQFDSDVILPDTTENVPDDVLQATNRIRRQFGASPLASIEGLPRSSGSQIAVGPVQFSFTGRASWYGPGFHGRRSASGEVFDQNALTAAHRTLPFGTLVRVTNVNNGASVTVRITDRGPFGGGRVLDLSAGAARAIGMIQAGVATVQADVLGSGE